MTSNKKAKPNQNQNQRQESQLIVSGKRRGKRSGRRQNEREKKALMKEIKTRISILLNPDTRNLLLFNQNNNMNLSDILPKEFLPKEMVANANTPKGAKGRKEDGDQSGSSAKKTFNVIKCMYDDCNFAAKYKKIVRDHEQNCHGKASTTSPDTSTESNQENTTGNSSVINVEAQIHDSMDGRPHSTQVDQIEQITQDLQYVPSTSYDGQRGAKRKGRGNGESEGEEDDDRKKAREDDSKEEQVEQASQSPESVERRRKMAETKLFLQQKQIEVAKARVMGILDSDDDVDNGTANNDSKMEVSQNLLEGRDEGGIKDSLDLTSQANPDAVEVLDDTTDPSEELASLHRELGFKTKSLDDALAECDVLRTGGRHGEEHLQVPEDQVRSGQEGFHRSQ